MSHVDEGALHAYLDGALEEYPADEAARVREHLERCAECSARLERERLIRDDASAILGLAVPDVTVPTLEELRAYVRSMPAPTTRASTRLHRVGWAASIVLALGTGWMLRGGQVPTGSPSTGADAVLQRAVGDQGPASEAPAVTRSGGSDGAASERAEAARRDADAVRTVAPAAEAARLAAEAAAPAAEAEVPPTGAGAAAEEEAPAAGTTAAAAALDAPAALIDRAAAGPDAAGAAAPPAAGDAAPAAAVDERPAAAVDDRERRVAGSILADSLLLDRARAAAPDAVSSSVRRAAPPSAAAEADVVSGYPSDGLGEVAPADSTTESLAVPGLDVLDVVAISWPRDAAAPAGVRVLQRLENGDTLELIHLPDGVDPSVVAPLDEHLNELVVRRPAGWLVMRAAVGAASLADLLHRLDSGF